MIGVPAALLTFVGILFFLILLALVFIPNFFSEKCGSHEAGYEYVCKLVGRGW